MLDASSSVSSPYVGLGANLILTYIYAVSGRRWALTATIVSEDDKPGQSLSDLVMIACSLCCPTCVRYSYVTPSFDQPAVNDYEQHHPLLSRYCKDVSPRFSFPRDRQQAHPNLFAASY